MRRERALKVVLVVVGLIFDIMDVITQACWGVLVLLAVVGLLFIVGGVLDR